MTLIGLIVLLAFGLGWEPVWRPLSDGPSTHPWTAISLSLLGVSALLARPAKQSDASAVLAVFAASIALARLLTAVSGHADLFQEWSPFHLTLQAEASAGHPIVMGIRTAEMIFLLAAALCLVRARHAGLSQIVAFIAAFPLLISVIGYLFGSRNFQGAVALPTLAAGLLCVAAVLCRTAHRAPFRSILTAGKLSQFARFQIGILVGLSLLLGLIATRSGFDTAPEVLSVEAAIMVLIIVLVVGSTARRLEKLYLATGGGSMLLQALSGAWDRGEIFLVYQPQIDLVTGEFVGVEALVRWQHPINGLISPKDFIPLAESSGLIIPLGAWVFKTACAQAARWQGSSLDSVIVAVNASAFQLVKPGFLRMVVQTLLETGLPPNRLALEVTESAMMRETQDALRILRELRDLGILIAIDDFGTGYSSLSYLRNLPSDYLKIDQSFVQGLPGDPGAVTISRAVIALGHSFGLKVIAEGVETPEQADFLREQGCNKGQGYLYSRPLPLDALPEWAEAWSRHGAARSTQHQVLP